MVKMTVDAMGDHCPIPVVKTKKALGKLQGAGQIEVLVDNETAMKNVMKMAKSSGASAESEKISDREYKEAGESDHNPAAENGSNSSAQGMNKVQLSSAGCATCIGTVVAVSSDKMGSGNDELGAVLMKSFFFAETQLDTLPDKILFYNGGAKLTVEGSDCLEDIRILEKEGVEILTCGTCLDFYGLKEKLAVGAVTNMYTIAEILQNAVSVVSP